MTNVIYEHHFLISSFEHLACCGLPLIQSLPDLSALKQIAPSLPDDAHIFPDIEPVTQGLQQVIIRITSQSVGNPVDSTTKQAITHCFSEVMGGLGHEPCNENAPSSDIRLPKKPQWGHIVLNLLVLAGLMVLSLALAPSLPLTISLIAVSFITTAYTCRQYFIQFWLNLRAKQGLTMSTGVSLGWILSLAHALYHTISMPSMVVGFSMTFMNVMMPMILVTMVTTMDVLHGFIQRSMGGMELQGLKSLFHLSERYQSFSLDESDAAMIDWSAVNWVECPKFALQEGMYLRIRPGECVPVDGTLVHGQANFNTAIRNGEANVSLSASDEVSAGSIHLDGEAVVMLVKKASYASTINDVLISANRARPVRPPQSTSFFHYLYGGVVSSGIFVSLLVPGVLGILTVSLALQNLMGIVFAICPCTIVIAHRLPELLMQARLRKQGVVWREDALLHHTESIRRIVFDKTGTLTSTSKVVDTDIEDQGLWERIYLLEKNYGREHPLAKAICAHFSKKSTSLIFKNTQNPQYDPKHRGLQAEVQGRLIQVGNYDYIQSCMNERATQILPEPGCFSPAIQAKLNNGYTPVYVAQDGAYQGVIMIEHTVEPAVLTALKALHQKGTHLTLLTGDKQDAADRFHRQCDRVFDEVIGEQSPADKEKKLQSMMSDKAYTASDLCFVGDELNDAAAAATVSAAGGLSCAMHAKDKAAFFSDISLNGSLAFLLLGNALKKNIRQNQGILLFGSLIFLLLLVCLPIAGIGMAPWIPLVIMMGTTAMTLFNAWRIQVAVDITFEANPSWFKRYFSSDITLMILVVGITLLVASLLIMGFATGHLAIPAFVFSAGVGVGASSGCLLAAVVMFGGFAGLVCADMISAYCKPSDAKTVCNEEKQQVATTLQRGHASMNSQSRQGLRPVPGYQRVSVGIVDNVKPLSV